MPRMPSGRTGSVSRRFYATCGQSVDSDQEMLCGLIYQALVTRVVVTGQGLRGSFDFPRLLCVVGLAQPLTESTQRVQGRGLAAQATEHDQRVLDGIKVLGRIGSDGRQATRPATELVDPALEIGRVNALEAGQEGQIGRAGPHDQGVAPVIGKTHVIA